MTASAILMIMVACVSAASLAQLRDSIYWRKHSYEVLVSSQAVFNALIDTEQGLHRYVLTGQEEGLDVDDRGIAELPVLLGELRLLTLDNPVQQHTCAQLDQDLIDVLSYSRRLLETHSSLGLQAAIALESSGEGHRVVDRMQAHLISFTTEEHRLLLEREARAQEDFRKATHLLVIGSALAAGLLILAHLMASREVNRRRRTEARLAEVSMLQAAMLNAANYGIVSCDMRGKLTTMNATAERMFGYTAAELVGKATPLLWHDPGEVAARAAALSAKLGKSVKPGLAVFTTNISPGQIEESEWTLIRKDGSRFFGTLTVTPIADPLGQVVGFLGVHADITERKQREAEALAQRHEMDRLKREFISTVSHELRTPLTSIRGSLGLVDAGVLGTLPEKARAMVKIAHHNSERLVRIINDILDVEKIESGKLDLQIGDVALAPLLREALEHNAPYGEKYQVSLVLESAPEDTQVRADADRLRQVLANLLSNAAKFSPAGAAVRVRAVRAGTLVRVEVQDSGTGIPEEFRGRIFEKFAQADSSSARRFEGTGLGLSITRRLVEAMGGSIGFTTETGRGTTFYFELPACGSAGRAAVVGESPTSRNRVLAFEPKPARAPRPRILHVEDDGDLSQVIATALAGRADVVTAPTLQAAEELLSKEEFSLVLLDVGLPDGNGLRLLDRLKQLAHDTTPVVILSVSDVHQTVQERVAATLVKSRLSETEVVQTILSLIARSQANTRMTSSGG
jgi:signal transduction histidine kinase/CHASE3 domain sensor protein/ActR/RegA family two-component response regulator